MFLAKGAKAWLSSLYIKDGCSGKIFLHRISRSKNSSKRFFEIGLAQNPSPFIYPSESPVFIGVSEGEGYFSTLHHPSSTVHPIFSVCYALNFPNFPICKSKVMNLFCQLRINLCSKLSNISSKLWDTSSKLSNISSKLWDTSSKLSNISSKL